MIKQNKIRKDSLFGLLITDIKFQILDNCPIILIQGAPQEIKKDYLISFFQKLICLLLYQFYFKMSLKRNFEIRMVNAHIVIPPGRYTYEEA